MLIFQILLARRRKELPNFMDNFLFTSEPGLKQFYYQLNPDFWNWLEKLTGRKLTNEAQTGLPVEIENLATD